MFKHIVTYSFEHTLSDINHHSCIDKCGNNTCKENASKNCQCFIKACKIRGFLPDQRKDKIIQQVSQRKGYRSCRNCTDKNTEKYKDKLKLIFFCHIFQKTFRSFHVFFGHSRFLIFIHPLLLLSPEIRTLLCK